MRVRGLTVLYERAEASSQSNNIGRSKGSKWKALLGVKAAVIAPMRESSRGELSERYSHGQGTSHGSQYPGMLDDDSVRPVRVAQGSTLPPRKAAAAQPVGEGSYGLVSGESTYRATQARRPSYGPGHEACLRSSSFQTQVQVAQRESYTGSVSDGSLEPDFQTPNRCSNASSAGRAVQQHMPLAICSGELKPSCGTAAPAAVPSQSSAPGGPSAAAPPLKVELPSNIPASRFVLNARFLGRFFMRNAKKANSVVAVYPERDHAVSRHNMHSVLATNSQIARPYKTTSFRLAEMMLLEPEPVLERLLKNVIAEETLRKVCADKVRRVVVERPGGSGGVDPPL